MVEPLSGPWLGEALGLEQSVAASALTAHAPTAHLKATKVRRLSVPEPPCGGSHARPFGIRLRRPKRRTVARLGYGSARGWPPSPARAWTAWRRAARSEPYTLPSVHGPHPSRCPFRWCTAEPACCPLAAKDGSAVRERWFLYWFL